jgi:protein-S-isoprenylcysteine O-methyltransferase Ste14
MKARLFVWLGGATFVGSLAFCGWSYLVTWSASVGRGYLDGWLAVAADAALFSVFAMHHSVLAREGVKTRLARSIPEPLLRSVYVWIASGLLILVCAIWRPVGGEIYRATGWRALAHAAAQLAGLWLIALSVRAIDPLELAGIRDPVVRTSTTLQITGPYRWVRHPLYLGWMLAVFGAAHMTGDRLAFAVISSIYLILAVPWEEQSLRRSVGEEYAAYARAVRWRIIPFVY